MAPSYVPGLASARNPTRVNDAELELVKQALWRPDNGRFYSMFPASTPKHARNSGPRSSERTESMSRLYIHGRGPQIHDQNLAKSIGHLYTGGVRVGDAKERTGGRDSPNGFGFFDFLLGQTSITYQEREQAGDTRSDNTVVYHSGQSAPVLSGRGAFLNTYQDDQNVWFQYAYHEGLRGSQLANRGQIASLLSDSFRYDGYMSSLSVQTVANITNAVMFSFTFRVKQISVVTPVLYSAAATDAVWNTRQDLLIVTTPSSIDDETRTGVESAVNPVAPRAMPSAAASADAAARDPRAVAEQATAPASEAQVSTDTQLAIQQAAVASVRAEIANNGVDISAVLSAETAISGSGDVAPNAVPPSSVAATMPTLEQQRLAAIEGGTVVAYNPGVEVPRDPSSGRFLGVGSSGELPVIDVQNSYYASASVGADRVAAAAQLGASNAAGIGQRYVGVSSTLPAYAQSRTQLPGGFTDIYRVQGTVFAEAYARAAAEVAAVQTASGKVSARVGRRSRRRQSSAVSASL